MQRILQMAAVVLCLPSMVWANNGMTGETFGLGPAETVTETRYVAQETFGLGQAVVVYQDCPGGVCPLPVQRTTSVTRQPILRPRTTIQRTVVETCPGGVCPLPQSGPVVRYASPVVSRSSVSNCPTCPQPTYYSEPVRYTRSVSYSPQWTFPGDLDSHLMGAPHYVSAAELSTMTYDQKLQLHDSQHNSMGSGRSYGVFRQRSRPVGWRFRPFLRMRMGW